MKASTAFFVCARWPVRCLGWIAPVLCPATASFTQLLSAQQSFAPGTLDTNFASQLNGSVEAVLVQPDGHLLVTGGFSIAGVPSHTRLARLTANGAYDPTFAPTSGVPWQITALGVHPDGRVLAGSEWEYLKRFFPDGSLDPNFRLRLPTPDPDRIHCCYLRTTALTVQPDDRILVAGYRLYRGSEEFIWIDPRVYRLLPDGSLDDSFAPYPAIVRKLAIGADQRVLVAGAGLTRLHADGTRDTNFIVGPFSPSNIRTFAVQSDGRILVGGSFMNIQGHVRYHIARLRPDGQLDSSFNPPPSTGYSPRVNDIAVQSDGRILVGGTFDTMGGLPYAGLARLNPDGSLDHTFPPINGIQADGEGAVSFVAIQDETRALVGGYGLGTDGVFESGSLFRIHLGEPAPRLSILQAAGGLLQLTYTYSGSYAFAVLSTTNLSLPRSDWSPLGSASNIGGGLYQFTDRVVTSEPQRYYQLRAMSTRQHE